ncbi:ATP-binding protein [Flammeovirga yaeyamensis]|uniref:ATP-binding protein n=2 Tax=Flammeovirgaceae TaxID=200667 RepID=A0AAX1N9N0_9BACT|nr:ATP-binding protein [Flammeovirga sp. MY04]NMF37775.1 ATP-binding protein [Flammeovirga yaeyamensis]QWG03917.1 ATP-binding protein [Flammeovirga yaeyamensis]
MNKPFKLKIPSLIENVRIAESFIDQARDEFNFNDDIYGNIMIAVTESVNNAIIHGNRNDKEKNVHLELDVTEKEISFTIEDEGKGFDFDALPDPTAPENIDKPGGRGIFLMKHLADEVEFSKEGRAITLTFYI